MTNQTTPRKDAAQKRREYMLVYGGLKTLGYGSALVIVVCGFGFGWKAYEWIMDHAAGWWVVVTFLNVMIYGYSMLFGLKAIWAAQSKVDAIPYVPPVAEQLAALPAEDVLLRGSDQPTAAPDELLRAAHDRSETEAEVLVRADYYVADR